MDKDDDDTDTTAHLLVASPSAGLVYGLNGIGEINAKMSGWRSAVETGERNERVDGRS